MVQYYFATFTLIPSFLLVDLCIVHVLGRPQALRPHVFDVLGSHRNADGAQNPFSLDR